jgi:VIT1/CCC1 family predicted Fe2+/Mn2+ transporter
VNRVGTAHPAVVERFRAAVTDPESLRSWTLVANDGIIATAGILEGFAGAGATNRTLLTAATMATIAGMLSVGGVHWAERSAEREAQLRAAEEEAREVALRPHSEQAALAAYYEGKGLAPELAREVAAQLMDHDAVDAQLESEHGILEITSRATAVRAGIGAAVAYGLGAAIPLLTTVITPVQLETGVIFAAVLVSLTITAFIGALTGRTDLRRTLVRNLAVGMGTMAVSFAIGRLVF